MSFKEDKTIYLGEKDLTNHLPEIGADAVINEIVVGLKAKQKSISPKYFYDKIGSELFQEITHLQEYYPTRCEKEILSTVVSKLNIDFNNLDIIELGSGDASKIKTILGQINPDVLASINYYPVDISESAIQNSIQDIIKDYKLNSISGIIADFLHSHKYMPRRNKRLFCFLGGTIGNLSSEEVEIFMSELGKEMEEGDSLLLGVDMVKDINIIESAYNDKRGVTANFNKNILNVVNSHIQSDFDTADFEHLAFYNKDKDRIEMHLRAKRDLQINIGCTNEVIEFAEGQNIHTENSCKYSPDRLAEIGGFGNLKIEQIFSDSNGWFSLVYFRK